MPTAIGTQQEQGRLQKEASQQQHATNLYTTVTLITAETTAAT
jgi:hypothetical protein